MHFVYIDDSKDNDSQKNPRCVFVALLVPDDRWLDAFTRLREFRRDLNKRYGLFINKELHASEFVTGRGRISNRIVTKWQRSQIFHQTLQMIPQLPGVQIISACDSKSMEMRLFERLVNRLNKSMEKSGSQAVLFCDEGNNVEYTRLVRKMSVYNPIPSRYGVWTETGVNWKNIPLRYILEDPVFKDSRQSFFIQIVDFIAYGLLRQENQVASRNKYNIHEAFNSLDPILITEAYSGDPRGIIRAK